MSDLDLWFLSGFARRCSIENLSVNLLNSFKVVNFCLVPVSWRIRRHFCGNT